MDRRLLCGALISVVVGLVMATGCGGSVGGRTGLSISATSPVNGEPAASTAKRITATFSAPMDAATLTSASFSATSPGGPLVGAVGCVDNTATLLLNNPLPPNSLITATITTAVKDKNGNGLAAPYVWTFTTGASGDTTPPTVSSTDPSNTDTGVVLNKKIVVVFSEPMAPLSLNATTFKVQSLGGPVVGTVSLLNNVATFKPSGNLAPATVYTATVTTGATDLSDNALATDKVWTFTTGTNLDKTSPTVISTDPVDLANGVPINKKVSATFSEAMDVSTIDAASFTLRAPNGAVVLASIAYTDKVAVLEPNAPLVASSLYTATISTAVKDAAGNALAKTKKWSFTTAAVGDTTPPTVLSTNPADNAGNVFLNQSVNATFSEAMQANSITTATFSVAGVQGSVTYDTGSHIATFKPSSDFAPNTTYTARIETGAKDSAGNSLASPKVWVFTTGAQRSQPGINLGAASTYAVLAGSTVTNAGPTVINGDLGLSPGTAVTGFPPGRVNGAIHAGDSLAAHAKTDLLAAQLDAAGRLGGLTLPGDLSGLTFTPGLYKNSTSVMLSAGNVTLDAQGDVNAVFIFQMGSTLTTSPGTHVILAGGAKAGNIYWSVGSSATLGVNSVFKGVILAEVSITVNTGATNDGVLLTKIGAVTLQSNTVTRTSQIRK